MTLDPNVINSTAPAQVAPDTPAAPPSAAPVAAPASQAPPAAVPAQAPAVAPSGSSQPQQAPAQNQATQSQPVASYAGGPSYRANPDTGAIEEAPSNMRKGKVGILGSMLLGALSSVQGALTAGPVGPGQSGIAAGAAASQKYKDEKVQQAKEGAQQNFQNYNAADKAKLEHSLMVQNVTRIAQEMNHNAKMYPFEEENEALNTQNNRGIAEINQMQLKESREKYTQWAIENDVPLGDSITDLGKISPQLPQIIGTKTDPPSLTPVPNDGVGKDNGIHLVPTQAFQAPMKTPFIVRTWSGAKDQKTGEFIPTEHIVSPTDVNPVTGKPFTLADINNIQNKSDVQLINLQHQEIDWNNKQQEARDKHAESGTKQELESAQAGQATATAKKENADAAKINAEAKLTGVLNPKGSEGLTGEAYLATLPENFRGAIQAVGEGRQTTSDRQLLGKDGLPTPFGEALYKAYPDYQVQNARTWEKTKNEYMGSGATAKKVVSYSTSMEHMQDLYDSTTKEGMFNPLSKDYQKRQAAIGFVNNEVGTAIKTGVMSEKEGNEILKGITGALTPGLNRERIQETAKLLHDKVDEFQTKFQAGAPSSAVKVPTLMSAKGAASYDYVRSGGKINPENGIQVIDPRGGVHTFPDQASADKFKQAAGIK